MVMSSSSMKKKKKRRTTLAGASDLRKVQKSDEMQPFSSNSELPVLQLTPSAIIATEQKLPGNTPDSTFHILYNQNSRSPKRQPASPGKSPKGLEVEGGVSRGRISPKRDGIGVYGRSFSHGDNSALLMQDLDNFKVFSTRKKPFTKEKNDTSDSALCTPTTRQSSAFFLNDDDVVLW
eukprot:CAMPEP_0174267908 /NCGR_PEP_ID=MMETSP0439-20130205/35383_1 /TAXON_ID=0 /ORGANISM="Stereomyxa ramosa, Strain Chinc5" /LENGTH=177 /DNA_ID=CAMNT_0015355709 /DNA_START=501 /DNA_END=1031 /DNA_ORIENTATION=+